MPTTLFLHADNQIFYCILGTNQDWPAYQGKQLPQPNEALLVTHHENIEALIDGYKGDFNVTPKECTAMVDYFRAADAQGRVKWGVFLVTKEGITALIDFLKEHNFKWDPKRRIDFFLPQDLRHYIENDNGRENLTVWWVR
jgi:hypothetical protein